MPNSNTDSSERFVPVSKRVSPASSPSVKGKSLALPNEAGSAAEHCTRKPMKGKFKITRTYKRGGRDTIGNCNWCGELLRIYKSERKARAACVIDGKRAKRLVFDMNALVYMSMKCIEQQEAMMATLNRIINIDPCSSSATWGDVIVID